MQPHTDVTGLHSHFRRACARSLAACAVALFVSGCASTQGIAEFTAYHQAYTSASETGHAVLDRLAVAERRVFETSEPEMNPDTLGFEVGEARYYVQSLDPPATASLRSSVDVVRFYNDAIIGLANGQATAAMLAQISLIGNAAIDASAQIAGLAGVPLVDFTAITTKLVDPLKALQPLAGFALQQRNRDEFRRRLVHEHRHVDAVLAALIDATPDIYAVLTRPLARSKKSVSGTKPFTDEEKAELKQLRAALANWVILLQGSRSALTMAVRVVNSESGAVSPAGIVATATELTEAARQVRRNLAALGG